MKRRDYCKWTDMNADGFGSFDTECGSAFSLDCGDPIDNGLAFCPYCGGELIYLRREALTHVDGETKS